MRVFCVCGGEGGKEACTSSMRSRQVAWVYGFGCIYTGMCNAQTHTHTMSLHGVYVQPSVPLTTYVALVVYFTSPVTSIETRYEF